MAGTTKASKDRTLNRLMIAMAMILIVGIPLVGILYVLDQYRDPGPNLANRAIQTAEEAVRTSPNSAATRYTLAELYAAQGRYPEAISQYDEILKASPDTPAVLISRGQAEVATDKLDEAAADFQKVIDAKSGKEMANVDRQLEAAYYNLGAVELKRGHAKQAVDLLANAVRINTTDADALYVLGMALVQSGDPTTAIDSLRLAVALVPTGWCDPYSQLAVAYAAKNDTAGAAYANGMVAFCGHQYAEAQTQLTAASSGKYALDAFVGLGLLAEAQGDTAAAAQAYQKALAADPKNFAATTGLGRVNSATGPGVSSAPSASGGN